MGQDVSVDSLGDEWKGYVLRITGELSLACITCIIEREQQLTLRLRW